MYQPHNGIAGIIQEHGDQHPGEFGEIWGMLRSEPNQAESKRKKWRCVSQVWDPPAQF